MPTPSPLRILLCALAITLMSVALFLCIQGAVMLYELYQFIEWAKEFGE
jgi:hypothetical protein